jgi:phosphatidylserine decarboxylase
MSKMFLSLQKVVPQHGLSRLVGWLAQSEITVIRRTFIHLFAKACNISLADAERKHLDDYVSFNDFFTRALAEGARPLPQQPNALACPVDGTVSQIGKIQSDLLMQAKGHQYTLNSLAGTTGKGFEDGDFCTIYLAPSNYHRIHLPCDGKLVETRAVPGALFSVNGVTEAGIPGLFCRNERLVCRFDTEFGPMLLVLVGALIVASIETVWEGPASPYREEIVTTHDQDFKRGDEIGRFLLGSTVICCFAKDAVMSANSINEGSIVQLGQPLGTVNPR